MAITFNIWLQIENRKLSHTRGRISHLMMGSVIFSKITKSARTFQKCSKLSFFHFFFPSFHPSFFSILPSILSFSFLLLPWPCHAYFVSPPFLFFSFFLLPSFPSFSFLFLSLAHGSHFFSLPYEWAVPKYAQIEENEMERGYVVM